MKKLFASGILFALLFCSLKYISLWLYYRFIFLYLLPQSLYAFLGSINYTSCKNNGIRQGYLRCGEETTKWLAESRNWITIESCVFYLMTSDSSHCHTSPKIAKILIVKCYFSDWAILVIRSRLITTCGAS